MDATATLVLGNATPWLAQAQTPPWALAPGAGASSLLMGRLADERQSAVPNRPSLAANKVNTGSFAAMNIAANNANIHEKRQ